jgi:phosphate-selective porin OprO and OprP
MLIAVCLAALVGISDPPPTTIAVAVEQAPAKTKKEKDQKETAKDGDPDQGRDEQEPVKKTKKAKDPDQPKKAKKNKNALADDERSPDEPIDPDADHGEGGWSFSWKQHPSVRYGDWLRIDGEAKLQEDGHSSYGPVDGLSTWEFHRNRFGIKGYFTKHIEYEIEHEFTEQELTEKDIEVGITPKSQWKDVYVNLTHLKKAQLQIGKFKVPFGLDELTGVTHNDFVYRSLGANYLDPGRDIGVMAHASFFKHGLTYAAGVFDHDGDNAKSKKIEGGGRTIAARGTVVPLRRFTTASIGNIEFGSAFTLSALNDDSFRPNGLRGRTVMTQDTFYESVYVKGHRRRWEADADWTTGPASLRAEYTWESDDRLAQGIGDEDLPDARARAWYVSGRWILTGEDKRRPVKASEPFAQGGIGAIELAARYERMWFDSTPVGEAVALRNPRAETIFASGDKALTLGINWTLNRFVKIQVNGIREQVEDPQRNPVPNGAAFWSRVIRLQFVL